MARAAFWLTGDNAEAVAHGLRTTGAIITGAVLIMVAVFGGFASGDLVPLQQMLSFGFRIVLPVKAILLNLLSVGAAYGMVVSSSRPAPGPVS